MAIIQKTIEDIKRYIGMKILKGISAVMSRQMMRERKKRYEHCRSLCVRRSWKIQHCMPL